MCDSVRLLYLLTYLVEQHLDDAHVPAVARDEERRRAIVRRPVRISSRVEQQLQHLGVPHLASGVESVLAPVKPKLACAVLDEQLHNRRVAVQAGDRKRIQVRRARVHGCPMPKQQFSYLKPTTTTGSH